MIEGWFLLLLLLNHMHALNVTIIIREGAFPVGSSARYTDALLEITIPDNMDVFTCDIGTFTIWCRRFTQWFTRLDFNTDLFVSIM